MAPVGLQPAAGYDALVKAFRWSIPKRFNIGLACVDAWAARQPERDALIRRHRDGTITTLSYGALKRGSDRLAHALRARGIGRGDRVALLLPQSAETVIGHVAAYKLGAIVVPLAALFGVDALRYRLAAAGAKAILTDAAGVAKLDPIRGDLDHLEMILSVDGEDGAAESLDRAVEPFSDPFDAVGTSADDPALMIFTSGTTGPPKGALHGHRVLLGHVPGFCYAHESLPQPGDRVWTPSDWAWAGGLFNALFPALYCGVPVVHGPFRRFNPEAAFELMAATGVRNAFLPPTAVKMLRAVDRPRRRFDLKLRTILAAGEALGQEAFEWSRAELGLTINEVYGQTECNFVLGSCAAIGVSRAGAAGKPIPGRTVALFDQDGHRVPRGEIGEIAVKRPDPIMFLEYWRDRAATRAKFRGDWLLTGDQGAVGDGGYVRFVGREDDLITSAGYRIGPSEIEDCLIAHPAVALAAAVGKPDEVRTEIVKAFVVLKPGFEPSERLAAEIKAHVRARLSAAEYPREVAFVDEIPLTTTGKVIRRTFREQARQEAATPCADQA